LSFGDRPKVHLANAPREHHFTTIMGVLFVNGSVGLAVDFFFAGGNQIHPLSGIICWASTDGQSQPFKDMESAGNIVTNAYSKLREKKKGWGGGGRFADINNVDSARGGCKQRRDGGDLFFEMRGWVPNEKRSPKVAGRGRPGKRNRREPQVLSPAMWLGED